jgi:rod shape-determining protein MreD
MKGYKWHSAVFIILLVVLKPLTVEWFEIGGIKPDILMSVFIFASMSIKPPAPVIMGVITGMMLDMVYGRWLGLNIAVYVSAALMLKLFSRQVYRENVPAVSLFTFIAVYLLKNIHLLLSLGKRYLDGISLYQADILYISIYSAAVCGILSAIAFIIAFIRDGRIVARRAGE